jgi:hypothetical protein
MLLAAAAIATAAAGPAAVAAPLSSAHSAGSSRVAAGQPNPAQQVTWSVVPATSKGPDSRILFNYGVVKAGSTITDHVEIVNRSSQDASFSIYATDATGTSPQDALLLLKPGAKPVDIGAWTSFPGGAPQLSAIIPGNKAIIEPFTVKVPFQATPGDHTGAMTAQVQIQKPGANGIALTQTYRIAVPMEIRVPGALHAGLAVQSVATGFSVPINPFGNGSATISYTVANTGNVRITGSQEVTVSGPFGQSGFTTPPNLPTILPGDSIRVSTSVPGLFPDGPMTAKVTVKPGWPKNAIPIQPAAAVATDSASLFAVPWSLFGFVLLLIALAFGVRFYIRYRGRVRRAELAAVAAKARKEAERRILGPRVAANGHSATIGSVEPAPAEATSGTSTDPAAPGGTGGSEESGSTAE